MCRRRGCHHLPVSLAAGEVVTIGPFNLRGVRAADPGTAAADTGPAVRDRGKSYWRQVAETVWIAVAFGSGMALGALMAGAK